MRVIIVVAFLLMPSVTYASMIHVPADYNTIQEAITAAINGDTVMVSPGTYVENVDFLGKAIIVTSRKGPHRTIIDGNQNGSVVLFENNEGFDSVLNGFTITNGTGFYISSIYPPGPGGGGILCAETSPTITNNIIAYNQAARGGGIACHGGASPDIIDNIIKENHPITTYDPFGGGIYCFDNCAPLICRNLILNNGNRADYWRHGGGICVNRSYDHNPYIIDNIIIGNNSSTGYGGGIYYRESEDIYIINNIIAKNTAYNGGGIYATGDDMKIFNNTIYENVAEDSGGGIFNTWAWVPIQVINCILWRNSAPTHPQIVEDSITRVKHCVVQGGWSGLGFNNIDEDPCILDSLNNDYHLLFSSPCIDAGSNSVAIERFDNEGDPHIIVDFGIMTIGYCLICS